MHNTVRIDELDQAEPGSPFSWRTKPEVRLVGERAAECEYRSFVHRRRVDFENPAKLVITDEIEGPPGEHTLEQFWHPGCPTQLITPQSARIGTRSTLSVSDVDTITLTDGGEFGWRSPTLGTRMPAPVLVVRRVATLPARFTTELDFESE